MLPADSDLFAFLQSPGAPPLEAEPADVNGVLNGEGLDLGPEALAAADAARADLAARLDIDAEEPELVGLMPGEWGDTSLGCPAEDTAYAQVVTAGYSVMLDHMGTDYEYHVSSDGAIVVLCE